jgi:thiamine pyrophosphate-dependent acetolactate synthase large subunit-like protein
MTKFIEYSKELAPTIRKVIDLKEALKEFKETNEQYIEHNGYVKDAQEVLKVILETNEESKAILEEIAELAKDLKEGYEAAAKGTEFKPAEIGAFLQARAKEDGVDKVVAKGTVFASLDELLS